uniref:Ionotropic glutamate receptor C-terminal domain-containing protein n=1 Tax=Anopheles albimanus TaxID=7167 RepID=A0A182FDD5_ANOAL
MAVLYLDVSTNQRIRRLFEVYFNSTVPVRWNAKLLVLVDDGAMNHPWVLSVLTTYFNHLGIAFWCMTGERYGTTMKYSVSAAFGNTLWIAIGCAIGLGQIVLYLAKTSTKLGRWIRQAFWRPPLNSFFHITTEVLVFILIESYLAQVTSYLLVHRFHRDPITLEEFFATDIPIRYTDQQRTVFYALDANLSDRFLERAVPETTCEEFSEGCAHLDTVERATFFINNRVPFDLISGQKSSFILPEMLKSIRAQYLFARGATPFRDYFDLHLHWLRAFGFMDYTRRPYDYSLEAHWKRYVITNDLIQTKHMVPFWIFVGIGWSISVAVFLGERWPPWTAIRCHPMFNSASVAQTDSPTGNGDSIGLLGKRRVAPKSAREGQKITLLPSQNGYAISAGT